MTARADIDTSVLRAQGCRFHVYKSAAQTGLVSGATTQLTWDTETYDVGGNFASNIFTAPYAGIYSFDLNVYMSTALAAGKIYILVLRKGGVTFAEQDYQSSFAAGPTIRLTVAGVLLAASDTIDAAAYHNHGSDAAISNDVKFTNFSGRFVVT